jgi:hypothetical protein
MINNLSIYMERNGNCWRMDTDMYFRFIKHVHLYFRERVDISEDIYLRLSYAEIPVRSMDALCFLFGGYSRNKEELVLMEFFPEKVPLPWDKSFTLNLYTVNNEFITVIMDLIQ